MSSEIMARGSPVAEAEPMATAREGMIEEGKYEAAIAATAAENWAEFVLL